MARIDYDDAAAAAFQASRELPPDALSEWRTAVARHLAPRPGMRTLDLGAGTGRWAATLASWYGISVAAVEPSAAMRARSCHRCMIAGHAAAAPACHRDHGRRLAVHRHPPPPRPSRHLA